MENSVKPHTGDVGGSPNSELENAGPKNKNASLSRTCQSSDESVLCADLKAERKSKYLTTVHKSPRYLSTPSGPGSPTFSPAHPAFHVAPRLLARLLFPERAQNTLRGLAATVSLTLKTLGPNKSSWLAHLSFRSLLKQNPTHEGFLDLRQQHGPSLLLRAQQGPRLLSLPCFSSGHLIPFGVNMLR